MERRVSLYSSHRCLLNGRILVLPKS